VFAKIDKFDLPEKSCPSLLKIIQIPVLLHMYNYIYKIYIYIYIYIYKHISIHTHA